MHSARGNYGKRSKPKKTIPGIRNVAPTFGKVSHLTHSSKCSESFHVESDAERLLSHMLTLDPRVRAFWAQSITVDLIDKKILRTAEDVQEARSRHRNRIGPFFYTPDFLVEWIALARSAMEVKLEGFEGDSHYQAKLKLAASILMAHGYTFSVVVVPRDARHPLYSSLALLKQAAARTEQWPDAQQMQRIANCCHEKAITAIELCRQLNISMDLVPAMLVSGCVSANLIQQHITGRMLLTAAFGDLSHLELIDSVTV